MENGQVDDLVVGFVLKRKYEVQNWQGDPRLPCGRVPAFNHFYG